MEEAETIMANEMYIAPCPFCNEALINFSVGDDDSFFKTIYASCQGCGCMLQSSIDYKPYSSIQPGWSENRIGFENSYRDAWRTKIITKWNKRG